MDYSHIAALALTWGIFLLLAISFYGWGRLVLRSPMTRNEKPPACSLVIWLGWAFTIVVFQLLHLAFPLTVFNTSPVFIAGLINAILSLRRDKPVASQENAHSMIWYAGIALFIAGSWLISRAMLTPTTFDAGLYYIPTVKWFNTYPIVKGLGNLLVQLAFNQSYFLYAAAINFSPVFGHGRSIANSFLYLLTIATFVEQTVTLIQYYKRNRALPHPFVYLPAFLGLPVLVFRALTVTDISVPSPDLASALLQMVLFYLFGQLLAAWIDKRSLSRGQLAVTAILASTAITVKLSNSAIALIVLVFLFAYLWKHKEIPFARLIFVSCAVLALIWMGRSVLLSGVPVFPSTVGRLPVEWAMPAGLIRTEFQHIQAYARAEKDWRNVMGDRTMSWVSDWAQRNFSRFGNMIVYIAILCLFVAAASIVLLIQNQRVKRMSLEWAILLYPVVGLVYWFFTAPALRFANALGFLLPIAWVMFLVAIMENVQLKNPHTLFVLVLSITIMGTAGAIGIKARELPRISTDGWQPIPVAEVETLTSVSGLQVDVPVDHGYLCWETALPCTVMRYYHENIALINPDDMGDGFTLLGTDPDTVWLPDLD